MRTTRRANLEALARMGDHEAEAELESLPKLPPFAAHLMRFFWELHATRQNNGMGPSRLTRAEIHLWELDEAYPLERWERKALMAVDAAWFAFAAQSLNTPTKT